MQIINKPSNIIIDKVKQNGKEMILLALPKDPQTPLKFMLCLTVAAPYLPFQLIRTDVKLQIEAG
jgi:hypothetical protein